MDTFGSSKDFTSPELVIVGQIRTWVFAKTNHVPSILTCIFSLIEVLVIRDHSVE